MGDEIALSPTHHISSGISPGMPLYPDGPTISTGGAMATETAPVAATPAAIWEDFIDIFYAPSSVFRRRETGSFFIPMAIVTLLCAGLFYLNSGALQPMFDAEFDRAMAMAMRQNPNI